MSDFDTEYTDNPICPACGKEETDQWEYQFKNESVDSWCGHCDAKIRITQHIAVHYTTTLCE